MSYLENIKKEVTDIEEISSLVPTLPLTAEQKKLMEKIIKESLFARDYQLKQIEGTEDFVRNGK